MSAKPKGAKPFNYAYKDADRIYWRIEVTCITPKAVHMKWRLDVYSSISGFEGPQHEQEPWLSLEHQGQYNDPPSVLACIQEMSGHLNRFMLGFAKWGRRAAP